MPSSSPKSPRTFFVTTVTHGRRALLQSERMARLLMDVLYDYREQGRFLLHEFVIMPNHLHLLVTPASEASLEKVVQFIKGGFSYRARKELGVRFEIWQPGFTNHRLRDAEDYDRHLGYIRGNPVRANLVDRAEKYLYSSAHVGWTLDAAPLGLKPGWGVAVDREP